MPAVGKMTPCCKTTITLLVGFLLTFSVVDGEHRNDSIICKIHSIDAAQSSLQYFTKS